MGFVREIEEFHFEQVEFKILERYECRRSKNYAFLQCK